MSEDNQNPPVDVTSPETERRDSAIAAIRKRREEIIDKGTLDLLVPNYDGNLKVRYRDLNDKEHDALANKLERAKTQGDPEAEREAIAGILVAHCDRIYVREPESESWLVLEDDDGPLRFERRLVAILGLEGTLQKAKEVVLEVFSPKKDENLRCQPDAIAPHMNAIFAWRQGRVNEINGALLGE